MWLHFASYEFTALNKNSPCIEHINRGSQFGYNMINSFENDDESLALDAQNEWRKWKKKSFLELILPPVAIDDQMS